MERNRIGHQQSLGGRRALFAAYAICAAAVAGALIWGASLERDATDGAALRQAVHSVEAGLRGDSEAMASSAEAFLDDLDAALERDAKADEAVVAWRSEGDVMEAGARVLGTYVEGGVGASLVTSGYLDMSGNVWGAVVWDGEHWADVVLVTQTPGEREVAVRVARMMAPDGSGR